MFALFAFGYLFGFVGLLIAVPLGAAIGVLVRFAFSQYYVSPLYGTNAAVAAGDADAGTPRAKREFQRRCGINYRRIAIWPGRAANARLSTDAAVTVGRERVE